MKQYRFYILLLAVLIALMPVSAFASDVSSALWRGIMQITNTSTTATGVSLPVSINSTALIANGYVSDNLSDVVVQYNSADVPFMPGYGDNPWALFVDSAPTGTINYDLYTGGASGGDIQYFPGAGGMTIADDASLEFSDNFTSEWKGWIDSTVSEPLVYKIGAFKMYVSGSGNITSEIMDTTPTWLTPTSVSDPSTGWDDEGNTIDDDTGTYGDTTTTVANGAWSPFLEFTYSSAITLNQVRYWWSAAGATNIQVDIDYWDGSQWQDGYEGASGAESDWREQVVSVSSTTKVRWRIYNGDTVRVFRLYELDMGQETAAASVTATGVSSGEHTITVSQWEDISLDFDGVGDQISFGDVDPGNYLTLEAFVYLEDRDAGYTVWSKDGDANGYEFMFKVTTFGTVSFQVNHVPGAASAGTTTATVPLNERVYICARFTGTMGKVTINDTTETVFTDSASTVINSVYTTYIGTGVGTIDGRIDEARMYSRSISDAEVAANYNNGIPAEPDDSTGLVIRVELNENTGTTATDTSGNGNDGTITDATWYDDSLKLSIDGVEQATGAGASVPDNANDWVIGSDATPYIEYYHHTVGGTLVSDISWEYDSTFTDASGNSNDATPTFRTTSSDADVSANLTSLLPVSQSQPSTFTLTSIYSVLTGTPDTPGGMFGGDDYSNLPAEPVNEILDEADIPQAAWWYPFLFLGICIVGLIIYGATSSIRGQNGRIVEGQLDGSLFIMFLVMEGLLVAFGKMGPIPYWPAFLFPIAAIALILSKKHFSWG